MKIRGDFVTNSSSSSFILCFDKEHSFADFETYCNDYSYNDLLELIKGTMRYSNRSTDKEEAIEQVRYIINRFQERSVKDNSYKIEIENIKKRNPIERINNADSIVMVEIWDTDGGLLEWAIRNGFLESEFREYLAYILNVG